MHLKCSSATRPLGIEHVSGQSLSSIDVMMLEISAPRQEIKAHPASVKAKVSKTQDNTYSAPKSFKKSMLLLQHAKKSVTT